MPSRVTEPPRLIPSVWNVVLLGDSIRLGYQPWVARLLGERAQVWGPDQNGETTLKTLEHLDAWAISRDPDVIHFNCGLHDLKRLPDAPGCLVSLDDYRRHLRAIITRLRADTQATLIWATTTPVDDARHQNWKSFVRREADVLAYNEAGREVATQLGVRINDLHACITQAGLLNVLKNDGVHFLPEGDQRLARQVADAIASCFADPTPPKTREST